MPVSLRCVHRITHLQLQIIPNPVRKLRILKLVLKLICECARSTSFRGWESVNYATYFENFYVNCNFLSVKDTLWKLWDDIVFTLIDFIIRKFDFRVYLLNV
jgi:hypothetical protein